MKRKSDLKNISVLMFVIVIGILLLTLRTRISEAIISGLFVCGNVLIPSLFPFMILSSFAVKSGVFGSINRVSAPFMKKIFSLPEECFPCLFFGFTGGYPVCASMVSQLYESGKITRNDALHLLSFCVNAGPAFVVTAVGEMILGSETAGVIILASVCLASVITGLLFALFKRKTDREYKITSEKCNLSQSLAQAVSSSSGSIVSVCAWVLAFSAISAVISSFIKNKTAQLLYSAFSEITTGVASAAEFGGIPLVSAAVSFGGICVMCQLIPAIKKCGVKVCEYLAYRIVNAVLSFLTAKIILLFVPVSVNVFAGIEAQPWSYTAVSSAILLIMSAVLIFDISAGQNKSLRIYDITG